MAIMDSDRLAKAHAVFVRLALPPYTIHFKSASYMRESTLELLDKRVCKEVLKTTAQDLSVRQAIGTDGKFWAELVVLLRAAIPSLERRSFTIWDPSSVDYESTSGALIASNYPGLWKDLERLNDLISISRNVLTIGKAAQDLAAHTTLDTEVFRLINCCVRVTARGYDGEAGTGDEEKWQWIVNAYQKLLITSLQLVNNLVAQNERRKLMLWVALFDNTGTVASQPAVAPPIEPYGREESLSPEPVAGTPVPPVGTHDIIVAYGHQLTSPAIAKSKPVNAADPTPWPPPLPKELLAGRPSLSGSGYVLFGKRMRETIYMDYKALTGKRPMLAEVHFETARRWNAMDKNLKAGWDRMYVEELERYQDELLAWEKKLLAAGSHPPAALLRGPTSSGGGSEVPIQLSASEVEYKIDNLAGQLYDRYAAYYIDKNILTCPLPLPIGVPGGPLDAYSAGGDLLGPRPVRDEDKQMLFTAEAGTRILESGKAELMKRLEGYGEQGQFVGKRFDRTRSVSRTGELQSRPQRRASRHLASSVLDHTEGALPTTEGAEEHSNPATTPANGDAAPEDPSEPLDGEEDDREDDLEEEEEEEEEEDDPSDSEDYPGSTEDGRGLLTDVPLILGPSEIEVLPMLIMSGLVPPLPHTITHLNGAQIDELANMHTIRTHLLLSQSNGRNLLRELLIFVAAWDLREEELYFKFMVKILEAILKNGLMPYAYHSFRDRSRSKDIISPAQAVIMKLLTCIFRARGENSSGKTTDRAARTNTLPASMSSTAHAAPPSRVDLHILNFIFTEFRQHIIPQTCALIFLQGQIHLGRASPEDFPLNLWDMERMYEGVYQYLEFFAVLTEDGGKGGWKEVLGGWGMASELVTLLRELEGGIPKMESNTSGSIAGIGRNGRAKAKLQRSASADAVMMLPTLGIERPFDTTGTAGDLDLAPMSLLAANTSSEDDHIFEAATPLAYPEDMLNQTLNPLSTLDLPLPLPSSVSPPPTHPAPLDADEPSAFEWRNLKKLTVLVLSSLIWKNPLVQAQVRNYGGLEALVSCCRPDEHNPYIREHAIMCLRFAVEGCEENGEVIRAMGRRKGGDAEDQGVVVPGEVLEARGYETFMDGRGQVGLRRKEGEGRGKLGRLGGAGAMGMTAEKAAELMQSALRDLPVGIGASGSGMRGRVQEVDQSLDGSLEGDVE